MDRIRIWRVRHGTCVCSSVQTLPPQAALDGRLVVFVPSCLAEAAFAPRTPSEVAPVLSTLTRNGYEVDIAEANSDGSISDDVRRRLDGASAAVVWITEPHPGSVLETARAILSGLAESMPDLPRLVGGGCIPRLGSQLDFEGLAEPVRSSETGALLSHLRARTGQFVPQRQPFEIDALRDMDLESSLKPAPRLFENGERSLRLPTGSGCARRCAFCYHERSAVRLLPAADIADLMIHSYHRYGVRQFVLGEFDFLAGPRRALELAERLTDSGLPFRWAATASIPDLLALSDAEVATLVRSGLAALELGTETGTDSGLKRLGKDFRVVHTLRAHDRLVAAGIMPVHDFVFGWPGETARDRRGTLDLIDRLHRTAPRRRFRFRTYEAAPGTTMGDAVLAMGGARPRTLSDVLRRRGAQVRTMPWIPAALERRTRLLTEYLLPLAYGDGETMDAPRSRAQRALASLAKARCRTGWMAFPLDRALYGSARRGDEPPQNAAGS